MINDCLEKVKNRTFSSIPHCQERTMSLIKLHCIGGTRAGVFEDNENGKGEEETLPTIPLSSKTSNCPLVACSPQLVHHQFIFNFSDQSLTTFLDLV